MELISWSVSENNVVLHLNGIGYPMSFRIYTRFLLCFLLILPQSGFNQNDQKPIDKRSAIIQLAEGFIGYRYRAHVSNAIFDCSGFVKYLMSHIGKNVTRSSVSQVHDGRRVIDLSQAQPGDILVFKGRNARNNRPGHVGIVHHWGNDTLFFIHSSTSKGIRIDHMFDPYYAKRFLQVRDVIDHN